ncbi:MAG: urea ABC transporter permease subunit UrtC [Gloeomargarita sp. HHBFW_bins_205]
MGQRQRLLWLEIGVVVGTALALVFVIPPILVGLGQGFRVNLLGRFLALAIAGLAIDLIWGYTGLLSLGHGVFFGLGGYALAMHLKLQFPPDTQVRLPSFMPLYGVTELPWLWRPFFSFPFTLVAIILVPALLGALIGYLIFRNRIRGVYFSILTQALTIIFFNFFNGQQKLLNGTNGLTDFQTIFGYRVSDPQTQGVFYGLTVLALAASYGLCRWLTSGRFGCLLVAIRDDEPRVRMLGYNPTAVKVFVFAISAALAGLAGALYTPQTGIISPRVMDIAFSIEMVIWVAVGGRASLVGAVVGTLVVNFAKSLLSESFPQVWLFFLGGLFLAVVLLLPEGIVGWLRTTGWEWWQKTTGQRRLATYPKLELEMDADYEHLGDQRPNG